LSASRVLRQMRDSVRLSAENSYDQDSSEFLKSTHERSIVHGQGCETLHHANTYERCGVRHCNRLQL